MGPDDVFVDGIRCMWLMLHRMMVRIWGAGYFNEEGEGFSWARYENCNHI